MSGPTTSGRLLLLLTVAALLALLGLADWGQRLALKQAELSARTPMALLPDPPPLWQEGFLAGQRRFTAEARLMAILRDGADRAGLTYGLIEPVAGGTLGNLPLVAARLRVSGPAEGIQALLHGLESGTPALLIRRARLVGRTTATGREIDADLDVAGFWLEGGT